jgi:hypothetical protein
MTYTYINKTFSDHAPILIANSNSDVGPKIFRFLNMWTNHPTFNQLILSLWTKYPTSTSMEALAYKLKMIKIQLKEWNKRTFGDINVKLDHQENLVNSLEQLYIQNPIESNWNSLVNAKDQLEKTYSLHMEFLTQKFKEDWVIFGDSNSKLFHNILKNKTHANYFQSFTNHNQTPLNLNELKQEGINYFNNLFSSERTNHMEYLLDTIPKLVNDLDNEMLCAIPSEMEIWHNLSSMNKDGAPGPDGFTAKFFQTQWEIIKAELHNSIIQIFKGYPFPKAWKATFISLIPKKDRPSSFKDFRPISLCNVLYKLVSKILSTRLEKLLPKLISKEQGAFVENRIIHDNIALTQEMAQHIHTKIRGGNIILNIDMEKAFDRLEWHFIYKVMEKFGFSKSWIVLISNCIEDIPFSVLIKGSSSSFFTSSRGLRQGDPLSPGLFILAEEVLSRGISSLMDKKLVLPFQITKSIKGISHSLYADDIILFSNANANTLTNIMKFLKDYQVASGQRINNHKSKFYASKHIPLARKTKINNINNFDEGNLPFTYLGCNIFSGKSRPIYFDNIIQKIQDKLASWKAKLISKGGKLILIKHVLSSIPIHSLTIFDIPKTVITKIHSILANFLWSKDTKNPSKRWISWKEIIKTKQEGGLGIRSIYDVILALRCKRVFRLLNSNNIWSNMMVNIHGHITQKYKNNKVPNRWVHLKHAWSLIEPYIKKEENNTWTCSLTNDGTLTTKDAWNICRSKNINSSWGTHI